MRMTEMTEEIEGFCFQIISLAGTARSKYIEAVRRAREGKPEEADNLIQEGKKLFLKGHESHMKLLAAQEERIDSAQMQVLLMHAEDQLMSAETIGLMAADMIELYGLVRKEEKK